MVSPTFNKYVLERPYYTYDFMSFEKLKKECVIF